MQKNSVLVEISAEPEIEPIYSASLLPSGAVPSIFTIIFYLQSAFRLLRLEMQGVAAQPRAVAARPTLTYVALQLHSVFIENYANARISITMVLRQCAFARFNAAAITTHRGSGGVGRTQR
jgi:hypothetical protein